MALEAKKFTFERNFDPEFIEEIVQEDLEPILPPKLYTQEELEGAILIAKEEAKNLAEIEMRDSLEKQTNEIAILLYTQIEALCQTCQETYKNHFEYNAQLTCQILKKVFPILFKHHNQNELLAIIEDNMPALKKANEIQIHHSPSFSDVLKKMILEQFKSQNKSDALTFIEELSYKEHEISIRWEESGIERNSEEILEKIINQYRSKY